MRQKIKSALELSPHKIGDTLYWINIQQLDHGIKLSQSDEWMFENENHPKVFYERLKPKSWRVEGEVPKLHAYDFGTIMHLLCSIPVVQDFEITEVSRNPNTGEYTYKDVENNWMPQSCLFKNEQDAETEKTRILTLIQQWAHQGGII